MTETSVERELKLEPDAHFSLARLEPRFDEYVGSPARARRLHTIYYDTPDLRLTRWGCSLRLRRGEGWTLKLPVPHDGDALVREEHVFAEAGDGVPAGAIELATAYLRGAAPRPVAELRTLRVSRRVTTGEGDDLAEVVEDDVRVVEGRRVVRRFRQVEIELDAHAPDAALDAIGASLRSHGAGRPDPVPKNVRAIGARAGSPELAPNALDRDATLADLVRATLASSVERVIRFDAKLRTAPDERSVHGARVAVRRLRSALRTFRPVLEAAWADNLRERLAWLQDGLSAARDADAMIAGVMRRSEVLGDGDRHRIEDVLTPLRLSRDESYARVGAMLRDTRYVVLLQAIVDGAKHPVLEAAADAPARVALRAIMRAAWKALRKRVRSRTRPPSDRELHRIRIAAKRLRYAAEAVAPVGGRRARRLGRAAERLQSVLGEHHDAVVTSQRLRSVGASADVAFLAGTIAGLERVAALDARAAWRRPWRRARRAYRRSTRG